MRLHNKNNDGEALLTIKYDHISFSGLRGSGIVDYSRNWHYLR